MNNQNQNSNESQDQSPYIIEAASTGISRLRAVGLVAGGVAVCAALIGGSAFAMNAAPAEQSTVQQDSSNRVGQDVGQMAGSTDVSDGVVDDSTYPGTQTDASDAGGPVQDPANTSNPIVPTQDPGTSVAVPPISFGGGADGDDDGESADDESSGSQSNDDSAFNAGGSTSFSGGDDADEDHGDDHDSEESED